MKKASMFFLLFLGVLFACQKDDQRVIDSSYQPDINPANFTQSTVITNPYFPSAEGVTYVYEGQTGDGFEHVEEQRQPDTRLVNGIECIVVRFEAYVDGHLIEQAFDWYAQDNSGTVWYFGEEVNNYRTDGTLEDHDGSWEAGVDGAKPGIIMLANPIAGQAYREEYYFNEAEDEAEVMATGLSLSIPFGDFTSCIATRNFTALEPDVEEIKYYAPGIGLIKESDTGQTEELLLIAIQ